MSITLCGVGFWVGQGRFGTSGRASGGAGGVERSGAPALIEVAGTARSVVGNGFRLSGIERGRLVEVVGEGFLGDLVLFRLAGAYGELGLGWSTGRMEEWG